MLIGEARRRAASLNCLDGDPAARPCGLCEHCRQIGAGTYPYWFPIAPQGAANLIQIGQIRELQAKLLHKAGEGQWKVAVLSDAHRMREESQNCLLKTLEEPPDQTLLILLTGSPQDLLPTVRSRCRILDVRDERQAPEQREQELVLDILWAIQDQGYRGVFEKAAQVESSRKKKLPEFFGAMEHLFRNGLIASLCPDTGALSGKPRAGGLTASGAVFIQALNQVWRAGYLLERNVNALLVLENLFLNIRKLDIRVAEGGTHG